MQQRVAIITGAGRGLGRLFAKNLAAAGAAIVIAEIDERSALSVANEIRADGGRAIGLQTDVTDEASVNRMVAGAIAEFGRADILVNNAAVLEKLTRGPFEDLPAAEFMFALEVNVGGAFLCAKAVAPHMRANNWGRIVNMSSDTALTGNTGYLHYVTSKSALVGMTRSLARELGPHGISVNAIQPGLTETEVDRGPARRAAAEKVVASQCIPRQEVGEDLVGALLFLCSDASEFVTGQTIAVNGGFAFR